MKILLTILLTTVLALGIAATGDARASEADSHVMGGSTMDGDHRGSAASRSDSDDHQEGSAP